MKTRPKALTKALTGTVLAAALFTPILPSATTRADDEGHDRIRHVLLISIDGFHAVDLQKCEASHLCPNLARLAEHGTTYANASTTKPSDSFPGLLAQLTGGTSKSTGVYYDDSYDRTLFSPAGNPPAPCAAGPGAETNLAENLDVDQHSIDGGVNASLTGLNSAVAIGSRGAIRLKLGDTEQALGDFEAALALNPRQPVALFGRGLAKQRRGDGAGGAADIAAAKAIRADVADDFAKLGIE